MNHISKEILPNSTVELINGVNSILERIQPEILRRLGTIATIHEEGQDSTFVGDLADATDRLQSLVNVIYDSINEVPTQPISETSNTIAENEDTGTESANDEHIKDELDVTNEGSTELDITTPEQAKLEGAIISEEELNALRDEANLSPNEQLVVLTTLRYLSGFDEQISLKDIVNHVFGRSKLSRSEENRLIQIMGNTANHGHIRAYGKSYSYKSSEDRVAIHEDLHSKLPLKEDILSDEEQGIIDFIKSGVSTQGGDLNIGQIVRQYFKVDRLDSFEFQIFVEKLNDLSERGHLVHAKGSAWYGIRGSTGEEVTLSTDQLAPITTPVLEKHKGINFVSSNTDTDLLETKNDEQATASGPTVKSSEIPENIENKPELTEREDSIYLQIMKVASSGEFFAQKEIDLSSIEFSSDSAKRQAYTKLVSKLVECGILEDNGVAKGGKKYRLIKTSTTKGNNEQKPTQQSAKADTDQLEPIVQVIERRAATVERRIQRTDYQTPRPRAVHSQQRRTLVFAQTVKVGISDMLSSDEEGKITISSVCNKLSDSLGVSKSRAREILQDYIDQEIFFVNGTRKGSRLLSLTPPQTKEESTTKSSIRIPENGSRDPEITDDDIGIISQVFASLLKLQHVQQGKSISDLGQDIGVDETTDKQYRQLIRRLEKAGYLAIDRDATVKRNSGHSKRIQMARVRIPSQKIKERLKAHPQTTLEEIRVMLNK